MDIFETSSSITRRATTFNSFASIARPSLSPFSPGLSHELSEDRNSLRTGFGVGKVLGFQTDRTYRGGGRMDTSYSVNFMGFNKKLF